MTSTYCHAQYKDSLQLLLKGNLSPDSTQIQAENLLNNLRAKEYDSLPYLYQDYATWVYSFSVPKAVKFESKALMVAKNASKVDSSFVQRSALFLGFYYERNKQPLEAIRSYSEASSIDKESTFALRALERLGAGYLGILDYYKAIECLEVATSLLSKKNKPTTTLRSAYQNLSIAYRRTNTAKGYSQAAIYAERSDSIAKILPTSLTSKYQIKLTLAQLYNQHTNLNIAKSTRYYDEALELAKLLKDSSKISNIYYGKGALYNTTDFKKSEFFIKKAMRFCLPTDSLSQYYNYNGLATVEARSKKFESSISNRLTALQFVIKADVKNPQRIGYKEISNSEYIRNNLTGIQKLAETYLAFYEVSKDKNHLAASLDYFKLADRAIDLIKLNSREFKSKLFWQEISANLYGKAIRVSYLQNDFHTAFYFMEKNKALLLMEDLAKQRYIQTLALPKKYIEDEIAFNKSMLLINARLKEIALTTKQRDSLEKHKIDIAITFSKIQDSILGATNNLHFESKILSLQEAQEKLTPKNVLVSFHISADDGFGVYTNKENGYAIFITKNDAKLFEINELSKLQKDVFDLLQTLKEPQTSKVQIDQYAMLSNSIYERLFPSEELRHHIKNKTLLIAPDSYLSFIPFEALSIDRENTKYLIKNSIIRYTYSFSFLNNLNKNSTTEPRYLAFAPQEFIDQKLNPLTYNIGEINALASAYKGEKFTEQNATKSNFLKAVTQASIIHLATHANAQDAEAPWIAFQDEKIFLDELYVTRNNASLVVLSGCNTTIGKEETGEGIMSLARGFFYSGAESVISTLWSIDDRSSAQIVSEFYNNLKQGQSKATALHNAKLTYLNTHTLSEASPHYWASFILLGTDNSLPINDGQTPWFIVSVVGIVLIIFIFFQKKRKIEVRT